MDNETNTALLLNKEYKGKEDMVMATVNGKKPQMVKLSDIKVLVSGRYITLGEVLDSHTDELQALRKVIAKDRQKNEKVFRVLSREVEKLKKLVGVK